MGISSILRRKLSRAVESALPRAAHPSVPANPCAATRFRVETLEARVLFAAPAPFTADTDIGNPAQAGSSSVSGGVYTVSGGGADVFFQTDSFHYVSEPQTNVFIARVTSVGNSDTEAATGIMFRSSLAANAANVYLYLQPDHRVVFNTRATDGAASTMVNNVVGPFNAPLFLELAQVGGNVRGYLSTDGTTYQFLGAVPYTAGGLEGLAVNAHNANGLNTSTYDSIATTGGADIISPTAGGLVAPALVAQGQNTATFSITYADNVAVSRSTINGSEILVTGPNGYSQNATVVSATPNADGASIVVTYSVPAPNGVFGPQDNGAYTIDLLGNKVADTSGNFVAANAAFGTFAVNVPDITPPQAHLVPQATFVTHNATTLTVQVTYTDNVAINTAAGISRNNITITAPNGTLLNVTNAAVDINTNGTPRTVTYTVAAPSGLFTTLDNGNYQVDYVAGVTDTSGNPVPAGHLGSFSIGIVDTMPPIANGFDLPQGNVSTAGTTPVLFSIRYVDDMAVRLSTIGASNVSVLGPGGFLTVTLVSTSSTVDTGSITATYRALPQSGFFTSNQNGIYTVAVLGSGNPGVVTDTSGNVVVANPSIGTIGVSVTDVSQPMDFFSANDVTTAGGVTQSFKINYQDDINIESSTFGIGNVVVTGPNGQRLTVLSAVPDQPGDGTNRTVTYTVEAPNNAQFSSADNGTYTVHLVGLDANPVIPNTNPVLDSSNNGVPDNPAFGMFSVNIPVPVPQAVPTSFGDLNGKNVKLIIKDNHQQTVLSVTLLGGSGTATRDTASGKMNLAITDNGAGVTLIVRNKSGGPVSLGNVFVTGTINKFINPSTDISGTLYATGSIGTVKIHNLFGVIATPGPITALAVTGAMTNATVLSGAALGSDGLLGGSGSAADSFKSGMIGSIDIAKPAVGSLVGAGLDLVNGVFPDPADTVIGGTSSVINSIILRRGADAATHFVAGAFGKVKINSKVVSPAGNPTFVVL